MKKTTVTEMKLRIGTDWRMSSSGISNVPARGLFAANVAYVKVNTSETPSAMSMRSAVRNA